MNAHTPIQAEATDPLAKLRADFPDNQISKLPKESCAQIDERKTKREAGVSCKVCGGWHHKNAVHLDYVGHAALTDRLLDTDLRWSWEPMAFGQDGLPALDKNGGLWIKLTVCDVTRPGYGSADGKTGGNAVKELIGDALRNAAMRFGAALELWHKGNLHVADVGEPPQSAEELAISHLRSCAITKEVFAEAWGKNKAGWRDVLDDEAYARVVAEMKRLGNDLAAKAEADEKVKASAENLELTEDDLPDFLKA